MRRAGRHEAQLLALVKLTIKHAHQHHNTKIGVVPAVDEQCFEGRRDIAVGRRQARDQRFEHLVNALTCLGRDGERIGGVEPHHFLDLRLDTLGLCCRQV